MPIGRHAADAVRRYLSRGRPYLDRRHRPELFLNAKGGPLTRAGAFLILRRLAENGRPRPHSRPPAPPPPFVRHSLARGRRRPQIRSRNARACRSLHYRALHPRIRLRGGASCISGHIHMPAGSRSKERSDDRPAHRAVHGPGVGCGVADDEGRARQEHARAEAAARDLPVVRPAAALQLRLAQEQSATSCPCGAAPARPSRPRRGARAAARRPRRATRGSGSCRAAASRCGARRPRAGAPLRCRRASTSSCSSGRRSLTSPGWSRESRSSESSAEPRTAGLSSSSPRRSSSFFVRNRNWPIAR